MAQQKVSLVDFVQNKTDKFAYQAYYCEENMWQFAQQQRLRQVPAWVLLISNPQGCVAMARTRQCEGPKSLIFWDYHVIWLGFMEQQAWVVDLDSKLPRPVALPIYLQLSFPALIDANYRPLFRLIPATQYCETFSSDRRHMRREDGSYRAAPPTWPVIYDGQNHVLPQWLDFEDPDAPGEICNREELASWAEQQINTLG